VTNGRNSVATFGPSEWSFKFLTFELQEEMHKDIAKQRGFFLVD